MSNAEQINYTSIGSDAQIAPTLARDYFEILSDTLVGHLLPPFLATKKRKAMSTNKFYFFDCGVVNSLTGRTEIPAGTPEFGKNLEQAIYLELKNYLEYRKIDKKIEYWRSTSKFEIDFLIYDKLDNIIAIEVKASAHPSKKDYKGFAAFEEDFQLRRKIIVASVATPQLTENNIEILPVTTFLEKLWDGELI